MYGSLTFVDEAARRDSHQLTGAPKTKRTDGREMTEQSAAEPFYDLHVWSSIKDQPGPRLRRRRCPASVQNRQDVFLEAQKPARHSSQGGGGGVDDAHIDAHCALARDRWKPRKPWVGGARRLARRAEDVLTRDITQSGPTAS